MGVTGAKNDGVVVTIGDIRRARLQSNHHHQQTNTQLFTGQMPFQLPNQEHWRENHIPIVHSNAWWWWWRGGRKPAATTLPWRDTAAHPVTKCRTPSRVPSGLESSAHIHAGSLPQLRTAFFPLRLHPVFHEIPASLKHKYHPIL